MFAGRVAADPMPSVKQAEDLIKTAAEAARGELQRDPNFEGLTRDEMLDIQDDIETRALRDFVEGGGAGAQWEAWIRGFRYAGTQGTGAKSQEAWLYEQRDALDNPEQFNALLGVLVDLELITRAESNELAQERRD